MADPVAVALLSSPLVTHGGIQRVTRLLLDALGDSTRVSATRLCELNAEGERVHFREGARFSRELVSVLRRLPIPRLQIVVHVGLLAPAVTLGRLFRAPTIVVAHGTEAWGTVPRRHRLFTPLVDRVWAVSEFTRRQVPSAWGVAPERIDVIPLCLPDSGFEGVSPANRNGSTLVTVARLDVGYEYKGVDTVLRALPEIVRAVPEATYLVVGDGTGRPHLERLASELGVGHLVQFRGALTEAELRDVYSMSDVFVMPSRGRFEGKSPQGEGFGLVYLEAAAAHLPVVVGNAGGAPEAAVDGHNGLLVDPDDVSDVAAKCIRLLQDAGLRVAMGSAGRRLVRERFSYDRFKSDVDVLVGRMMDRPAVPVQS